VEDDMPRLPIAFVAFIFAGLALVGVHAAQGAVERPFPVITVNGEATLTLAPDIAQATVGVSTDGKTVREASEGNAQAMTAVAAALKQAGVEEKDIQTAQFTIQPIYSQGRQGREEPRITGYRVANQVRFKIRDTSKLSDILDRAIAAGATDLHGVTFTVSEPSKALDSARAQAIDDARRKAEIYARAAGAQVGRAVDIAETGTSAPPRPLALAPAAAERTAAAPPPISPGETTLRVTLTATFELLQ